MEKKFNQSPSPSPPQIFCPKQKPINFLFKKKSLQNNSSPELKAHLPAGLQKALHKKKKKNKKTALLNLTWLQNLHLTIPFINANISHFFSSIVHLLNWLPHD
jgi:hypothetical protein